jgi:hypothetical protein
LRLSNMNIVMINLEEEKKHLIISVKE